MMYFNILNLKILPKNIDIKSFAVATEFDINDIGNNNNNENKKKLFLDV